MKPSGSNNSIPLLCRSNFGKGESDKRQPQFLHSYHRPQEELKRNRSARN